MVLKRPFPEDSNGCSDGVSDAYEDVQLQQPQRRPRLESQSYDITEALRSPLLNEFLAKMEPLIRSSVREELQPFVRLLQGFIHQSTRPTTLHSHPGTSGTAKLQLRFLDKVPKYSYTQDKIAAEDGTPMKIAMFDITSGSIVHHGPFSSLKVDLCVLRGDFGLNDEEWTNQEFFGSIISERPGKRPLIDGNTKIKLDRGVGSIGEIALTDNSKWCKNGMFMLGAMVSGNEEIKGAKTEPFRVKDRRGECYEKHYPPLLDDPIWRLEKIAKKGQHHKQLSSRGIKTPKDLLRLYKTNPSLLAKCFEGIPKKKQDAIIKHALTCVVDDTVSYLYENKEPTIILLFDCIFNVVKVTFDGQIFLSPHDLTLNQKDMVETVKQYAYKNLNELISVDQNSTHSFLSPKELSLPDYPSVPGQYLQQYQIPFADHDLQLSVLQPDQGLNFTYPPVSTTFGTEPLQGIALGEVPEELFTGLESLVGVNAQLPSDKFRENCNQQIQWSNSFPAASWDDGNMFHFAPFRAAEVNILSSCPIPEKPKVSWITILAAAKWVRSVRQNELTNAKLLHYND